MTFFRHREQHQFEWIGRESKLGRWAPTVQLVGMYREAERFGGKLLRRKGTRRMYRKTDLQVLIGSCSGCTVLML